MRASATATRLAFSIVLAAVLAACSKSPEAQMASARSYAEKGDYQSAVLEFKTILQRDPSSRDARLLLGHAYYDTGSYVEAAKELSRARELGVPEEQVLPLLAKALLKSGEHQKVIDLGVPARRLSRESLASLQATRAKAFMALNKPEEVQKAIEAGSKADSQNPEVLVAKALVAFRDQQPAKAQELIEEALKRDSKYVDALYLKAGLLQGAGKNKEAIEALQAVVTEAPQEVNARVTAAMLYLRLGQVDAAEQTLVQSEKISPNYTMGRYVRGLIELQRGHLDAANAAAQDVLRAAPNYLPGMLLDAAVTYGQGHYEQSLRAAKGVLSKMPGNGYAVQVAAASLLHIGDSKGALEALTLSIGEDSKDPNALALAGESYLMAGDYPKAMDYLDRAAAIAPNDAVIKTNIAAGRLAMGDAEQAITALEQAATLSKNPAGADMRLVALYLRQKDYDQALAALDALERKMPRNPVTLNLRAAAYWGKADRGSARNALEQAVALSPTFFPAVANLALMDMQANDPKAAQGRFEAFLQKEKEKDNTAAMLALAGIAANTKNDQDYVRWLEEALRTDPRAQATRSMLIRYFMSKKDTASALKVAAEGVAANPDDSAALDLLGATQWAAGRNDEALATYTRLVEKVPNSALGYQRLGIAQAAAGKAADARVSLQKALDLKPDLMAARNALIRLDISEKRMDEALSIARQMQTLQPKSPEGYISEGDIYLTLGRPKLAEKPYQGALERGAGTDTALKLASVQKLGGDTDGAVRGLTTWLKQHPSDQRARVSMAQLFVDEGRYADAIAQYEQVQRSLPNDFGVLNNLGLLYQRTNDSRALPTAEKAYSLAPDRPHVIDTLGWILVAQGQLPRGLQLLQDAAEKAPKDPSIGYHYAVALSRSGDTAEAMKQLQSTVESTQKFSERDEAMALLNSLGADN